MAGCNVGEVLVDDEATGVDGTDICGCLVDFTDRSIDCLLLLLAIDEVGEEVAVLQFVVVVLVDDDDADLDVESLDILSTAISLSLFFDLYCRVDLDCLVIVVATILSVDVMVLR